MLESTHLNVTPVSGGVRQKLIIQSGDIKVETAE